MKGANGCVGSVLKTLNIALHQRNKLMTTCSKNWFYLFD